jgi:protein SCO1/2
VRSHGDSGRDYVRHLSDLCIDPKRCIVPTMNRISLSILAVSCLLFTVTDYSYALEDPANVNSKLQITQNIGQKLDFDLSFQDSAGNNVKLGQYFTAGRPVILVPVYYECPRLCTLVMDGILKLLNETSLRLGNEFNVLLVSFDPTEKPKQALKRMTGLRKRLNSEQSKGAANWEALVGESESVNPLMDQIGFTYFKDREEFAHSAMLLIASPDGVISQYFFGIEFPAWDVKLALIEASQGKLGSMVDHAMLFCFRFDPTKGRYTWAAFNLARSGAFAGFLALGLLLFKLWRNHSKTPIVKAL